MSLQERRRSLLLQLRVGLATCLRDLVKPVGPAGSAAAAGPSPGGVGSRASELLQLVGPDNHVSEAGTAQLPFFIYLHRHHPTADHCVLQSAL
jgi:hypothetical protein